MQHSKSDIRKRIALGELKEAVAEALEYALYCQLEEPANQLTISSSRLSDHVSKWNTGLLSYEEFSREQAKIAYQLTGILSSLPEKASPQRGQKKLLDEATFKKRLFYGLIAAKALVLLRLMYHSNFSSGTGGFTKAELFATMGLLAPVFVTYISAMLADYLRQHQRNEWRAPRYVSGPLVTMGYWLIPLHALALIYIIEQKAATELSFAEMNTGLALVETLLGGYIGQIVFAFFKKSDE